VIAGRRPTEAPPSLVYLSDAWLEAANDALEGMTPLLVRLRVGFKVAGRSSDPSATSAHTLILGADRVGLEQGLDDPDVTLTMDWDVAARIARGDSSAQRAFLDGLIELGGRPDQLLGHQADLAAVEDRLAAVRARTVF